MSSIAESIALAAPSFTGQLLRPTDHGYDDVRRVHNGLIDKRPAIIARCHGVADVVDAVRLARTLGLEVVGTRRRAQRRGPGDDRRRPDDRSVADEGHSRGCHARGLRALRAACSGEEFNRETQLHGLATTGGVVGSTGIAGLTLGGGLGWLMPKYGLALDNLRSADMVMADGTVVRASADENPDLFWAIRGGGGNFGIAASLEYALHQVGPMITGGVVVHPLPRALDVLRFFRDTCASCRTKRCWSPHFRPRRTARTPRVVGIVGSHCGSLEQGEVAFRPLKAFGPPVLDAMGPMPYSTLNGMLDPAFPKGALNYWKAQFVTDLSDDAIRTLIEGFRGVPIADEPHHHRALPWRGEPCSGGCDRLHDARHRLQRGHRLAVDGCRVRPNEASAWARETFASLTPFLAPTRYVNYLEDDARDAAAVAVRIESSAAQGDQDEVRP